MKTIAKINPGGVSEEESKTYKTRTAVRAVLFNDEGKMAFLYVGRDGYYKLPGGGVDEGESIEEALKREVVEEVGCNIEIGKEVGKVVEYKSHFKILQDSYVFLAKVTGGDCVPKFTDFEKERGFELVWVTFDEAVSLLQNSHPESEEGKFIIERDLKILEEAVASL
ncbi:MAG: ADP-ribose pyrophosphatase [Parcubacteria group bacterium CG11_big_fil_rev_8_21_14_0_20_39_22]|nr:MAG: ADP-ribose pyrophosphatase [Parcubacteria group bacterium CG11_big_fil_rev_8_21_14_0_20_39_22]